MGRGIPAWEFGRNNGRLREVVLGMGGTIFGRYLGFSSVLLSLASLKIQDWDEKRRLGKVEQFP
jgi:hypothetical protein